MLYAILRPIMEPATLMAIINTLLATVLGLFISFPMAFAFHRGLKEVRRADHQAVPSDAYWSLFQRGALATPRYYLYYLWLLWIPGSAVIVSLLHDVPLGAPPVGSWIMLALFPVAIALWNAVASVRFAPALTERRWCGPWLVGLANLAWVGLAIFIAELVVRKPLQDLGFIEIGRGYIPNHALIGRSAGRSVSYHADILPMIHLVVGLLAFAIATAATKAKGGAWFRADTEAEVGA